MLQSYISRNRLRITVALLALALIPVLAWAGGPGLVSPDNKASTGSMSALPNAPSGAGAVVAQGANGPSTQGASPATVGGVIVGHSVKNDVSPPLRDIPPVPLIKKAPSVENENPLNFTGNHKDQRDTIVQNFLAPLAMPTPILNFDGV